MSYFEIFNVLVYIGVNLIIFVLGFLIIHRRLRVRYVDRVNKIIDMVDECKRILRILDEELEEYRDRFKIDARKKNNK